MVILMRRRVVLLSRRDRLDDAKRLEPGELRDLRGVPARARVEDEEADLVLWDVDGAVEADRHSGARLLLGGRAGPSLARVALSGATAGEICLDEVARHLIEARTTPPARKRGNP
jgi:hypothetical protein